ncbi:MAG: hypothetical protein ACYC4D_08945 [Thermoleophilia bacterium]
MMLAIEIIVVVAAFIVLGYSGTKMVKKAVGFGRSAKTMNQHTQPRIMALMAQSDVAQQRVFSITGNADVLQRKLESLRITTGRMMVIINAIREAFDRISRGMRLLGF